MTARAPGLPPPVPADQTGRRADLSRLARGGWLSLFGAITNAVLGFVLVVVVTRGTHAQGAGRFFEGLALFTIASNIAELGADDGLVRMIPLFRRRGRTGDLRRTLNVAFWPVVAVGAFLGALMFAFAPAISNAFVRGADPNALVPYIRVLSPFIPLAAASSVALSGARGFGTIRPFVAVDNVGKPALRPVLVALAIATGLGSIGIAFAWAGPIIPGLLVAWLALTRLLARAQRRDRAAAPPTPTRALAREFWTFSAPRALSAILMTTVFWLDTLLIGALYSTRAAGIYAGATRYLTMGTLASSAILLVFAPQISGLLAEGARGRAGGLFQTTTSWIMLLAWPIFFTLAVFAPLLLSLLGPEFRAGAPALSTLAMAGLLAMASGPVNQILLMSGRSSWNLANTAASLVVNVALNLWLIPKYGIEGAAIAWAVAIAVLNVSALLEVGLSLGMWPFGPGVRIVGLAATIAFGGVGVLIRSQFGTSVIDFVIFAGLAVSLYAVMLWRYRDRIELPVLVGTLSGRLGKRRKGMTAPAGAGG